MIVLFRYCVHDVLMMLMICWCCDDVLSLFWCHVDNTLQSCVCLWCDCCDSNLFRCVIGGILMLRLMLAWYVDDAMFMSCWCRVDVIPMSFDVILMLFWFWLCLEIAFKLLWSHAYILHVGLFWRSLLLVEREGYFVASMSINNTRCREAQHVYIYI